ARILRRVQERALVQHNAHRSPATSTTPVRSHDLEVNASRERNNLLRLVLDEAGQQRRFADDGVSISINSSSLPLARRQEQRHPTLADAQLRRPVNQGAEIHRQNSHAAALATASAGDGEERVHHSPRLDLAPARQRLVGRPLSLRQRLAHERYEQGAPVGPAVPRQRVSEQRGVAQGSPHRHALPHDAPPWVAAMWLLSVSSGDDAFAFPGDKSSMPSNLLRLSINFGKSAGTAARIALNTRTMLATI